MCGNKTDLLDRAVAFAAAKHAGTKRKGTTIPYITHVVEAMEIVCRLTEDEEVRAAAVLHDTLEDTDTTRKELAELFGDRVADLVAAESENKREGQPEEDTWLIRKQETIRHLSEASTEIRIIALGDKLSNIRAMYRDYMVVGEKLWERFNQKDPVMQGMYYGLLANVFSKDEKLRNTPEYREYADLCSKVFSGTYDGEGNLIEKDEPEEEFYDEFLRRRGIWHIAEKLRTQKRYEVSEGLSLGIDLQSWDDYEIPYRGDVGATIRIDGSDCDSLVWWDAEKIVVFLEENDEVKQICESVGIRTVSINTPAETIKTLLKGENE